MPVFNQSRSNIIRLIFGGMFLVIFAQLFNLQVTQREANAGPLSPRSGTHR